MSAHPRTMSALATGLCAVIFAVSCDSATPEDAAVLIDVPETVALGEFPQPLTDGPEIDAPSLTAPPSDGSTTTTIAPISGPVGQEVSGNRILLIGDTVFAATAPRFDGQMCNALELFGWQGEIAAEPGRFVDFGRTVVEARVVPSEPDWDVAAVMLGNHFDGDVDAYTGELNALIRELSPRPIVVYTLVEDDTYQAELNEVIRGLPGFYPNVVVLDWAEITAAEPDVILADTPSGLSDEGLSRLGVFTVATLGDAPVSDGAGCLPSVFVDDSAIVI